MDTIFILYMTWNPSPEVFPWQLPLLGRPILWYGVLFALGFFFGYLVFLHMAGKLLKLSKRLASKLAEKVSFYVIIGAVAGARIGDVLFYQGPGVFVHDPLAVFRFWEGGLASHGAVVGILIALFILSRSKPAIPWQRYIDLLALPTLVAGACIRVGNFINQEIVGRVTGVPWAVIFLRPADGTLPLPRHPVQLYEAVGYLMVALFLWLLLPRLKKIGQLGGLFLTLCFSLRFFLEFFKQVQSELIPEGFPLTMGQLLSIPVVILGLFLLFQKSPRLPRVKRH
ncbi:MAG: Prolipoprotein diacylglyceryl transferase [Chlamydiae bacterium]|nr:Prolipoprotein diacylglyceryl transferase [Chlamydiota bacterium]